VSHFEYYRKALFQPASTHSPLTKTWSAQTSDACRLFAHFKELFVLEKK
jgi:hypothetical protein